MKSIRVKTEIPGPQSKALLQESARHVAAPLVPLGEIFISSGEGAVVEDVDGNRFIDFIGGIGCLIVGHNHPKVNAAISAQINKFAHTDYMWMPYENYATLASRISDLCGGNRKVGFFNSGAEAVENAIKVARSATGKPGIICFEGAFHGRTFMSMALTHKDDPYKKGFGPFPPGVHRAPYPNFDGATLKQSIDAVREIFKREQIAAVIVEPELGEGGFIVPPKKFLSELAKSCDENQAVLIADEVQTGYGRTGTFLASEQSGVRPGIVTLGKSIAAGIPLSAVVADPKWIDTLRKAALGGTYVGNPVAIEAGLAVLDVIEAERLMQRAIYIGERIREAYARLAFEGMREIRGLGSMIGVEFESEAHADHVVQGAAKRGVLLIKTGREGNVIRHLMPLVITDSQIDEAFEALDGISRTK